MSTSARDEQDVRRRAARGAVEDRLELQHHRTACLLRRATLGDGVELAATLMLLDDQNPTLVGATIVGSVGGDPVDLQVALVTIRTTTSSFNASSVSKAKRPNCNVVYERGILMGQEPRPSSRRYEEYILDGHVGTPADRSHRPRESREVHRRRNHRRRSRETHSDTLARAQRAVSASRAGGTVNRFSACSRPRACCTSCSCDRQRRLRTNPEVLELRSRTSWSTVRKWELSTIAHVHIG